MKKSFWKHTIRRSSVLFVGFACFFSYANPAKDIIFFDLDDVVIEAKGLTRALLPHFIWHPLTVYRSMREIKQLDIESGTMQLAYLAQQCPDLQQQFMEILTLAHTKRALIPETVDLIRKLKKKGYTVIGATNKDYVGLVIVAEHLKFDTLYEGKPLFDAIICHDPGLTMLKNYLKNMITKRPFATLDDFYERKLQTPVTITPHKKPDAAYYQVMKEMAGGKTVVFFDDSERNIIGARKVGIQAYRTPKNKQRLTAMLNALKKQMINI